MKNIKTYLFAMLVSLVACDDPLETPVKFNASIEANDNITVESDGTIIAPKGTEITFNFAGEPDFISFAYDIFNATTTELSFTSTLSWARNPDNTLQLFISRSFDGLSKTNAKADSILIQGHEWVNISSDCEFPTLQNGIQAANISLDDYKGDSITLAFRYKTSNNAGIQPMWTISDLQIDNKVIKTGQSSNKTIAATMGLVPFDMIKLSGDPYETNSSPGVWNLSDFSSLKIARTATGGNLNEDWLITRRIVIPKGKLEKGKTVAVKNTTNRVNSYKHTFNEEGEYTVVFRATNHNYKANSSVEKNFKVIINE